MLDIIMLEKQGQISIKMGLNREYRSKCEVLTTQYKNKKGKKLLKFWVETGFNI